MTDKTKLAEQILELEKMKRPPTVHTDEFGNSRVLNPSSGIEKAQASIAVKLARQTLDAYANTG